MNWALKHRQHRRFAAPWALIGIGLCLSGYAVFEGSSGCQANGPSWWGSIPWLGIVFHASLWMLLITKTTKVFPFVVGCGVIAQQWLLSQQVAYGVVCTICYVHLSIVSALFIVSILLFRPHWSKWALIEKFGALFIPAVAVFVTWMPGYETALAQSFRARPLYNGSFDYTLSVDPRHDVASIPSQWRNVVRPNSVIAFCGPCVGCRIALLDEADRLHVQFVAVFHSTQREIASTIGTTRAAKTIADPAGTFSKAMNAEPIRMFAVGAHYQILWAQPPRVTNVAWVGEIIPLAAQHLASGGGIQ